MAERVGVPHAPHWLDAWKGRPASACPPHQRPGHVPRERVGGVRSVEPRRDQAMLPMGPLTISLESGLTFSGLVDYAGRTDIIILSTTFDGCASTYGTFSETRARAVVALMIAVVTFSRIVMRALSAPSGDGAESAMFSST